VNHTHKTRLWSLLEVPIDISDGYSDALFKHEAIQDFPAKLKVRISVHQS